MAGILIVGAIAVHAQAPAFEVVAIKPTPPDSRGGKFATMQGTNRFASLFNGQAPVARC